MNKVLRIMLAIILTPVIMVWNIVICGVACIIGFVGGVIGGSAKTIDKVIDGKQ